MPTADRPRRPAARPRAAGPLARARGGADPLATDAGHADPVQVRYQPILDVAHAVTAGYQTHVASRAGGDLDLLRPWPLSGDTDGRLTAATVRIALAAAATMPPNTFLTIPVPVAVMQQDRVRRALLTGRAEASRRRERPLSGIVLDLVGPIETLSRDELTDAVAPLRAAGAMLGVGGYGAPQPELSSILGLRPSVIRLGRDWIRGLATSAAKRDALETIGSMADQLDAWILVEGVAAAEELEILADLRVPLAQGPFLGEPQAVWPGIASSAVPALPRVEDVGDGSLRALVQPARTTSDAAAATAVLPEIPGLGVIVVVGDDGRPTTVIEQDGADRWNAWEAMTVNVDTPVTDAVMRALTRPRSSRFSPLVCTDGAGRMLGVLRMERLIAHMARRETSDPAATS